MNKPKLNQPDVEATTTNPIIDQQAIVDFKRNNVELNFREYGLIKIEPDVITYNGNIYTAIDSLNPTLEQVQKEWENEGFEIISFKKEKIEIYKQWIERIKHCSHHRNVKICIEKDFFYIAGHFSNKYTQLLTKTFKALGWYDE